MSPRLGVTDISMISSSIPRYEKTGSPGVASAGKIKIPSATSLGTNFSSKPNSSNAHNIPFDGTPRILLFLILVWPPIQELGKATMTFSPAATLGAPQTICKGSSSPTSTWQTCRWSESGWGSHVNTCPTTTFFKPSLGRITPSTSTAVRSIFSDNSSTGMSSFK